MEASGVRLERRNMALWPLPGWSIDAFRPPPTYLSSGSIVVATDVSDLQPACPIG